MATLTSRLIVALTDRVSGPARGIGGALSRLHRQGQRTSGALMGTAGAFGGGMIRGALAVGASYYGMSKAIGGTVGAAIKFEEAFADVRKVVDGTPAQLSAVRSEIIDMSRRLPVTAEGLASIYAAAGQSGVALNELGKFSEMAAKVSVAWDTSQAETGEALAKIKTQLGFNVDQLGLHADAINHLANNTASAANDLVDFDKRVAAVGKMFGFSDTQTLAFGASMISAGAQSEVAATSFRNMGKALTIGERATKKQREAFSKLGLDSVKTAKKMQKDALNTTLDVMERIQKLPDWQRNSIASALFGDEARGLLPVIADARELRRELAMVGTEANYSGSAYQEFLIRSETTKNALQLIGNKIWAVGIGIGDSWLPTIQQLGLGIGDVLDTLEKRVGVLDQVKSAFQGFMGGIGYGGTGGARDAVNDIGDLIFGKAFGGSLRDADDRVIGLARLSNRFRGIGADIKAFADNVSGANIGAAIGNVGDAISKMGGGLSAGSALAIGIVGRGLIALSAGTVALALSPIGRIAIAATAVAALIDAAQGANSIGEFVDNLSKLSAFDLTVVAAGLGLVGLKIWSIVGGLRAWNSAKNGVTAPVKAVPKESVTGRKPTGPKTPEARVKPSAPDWINKGRPSNAATLVEEVKALFGPGSMARWVSGAAKGIAAAIVTNIGEGLINDGFRAAGINPDTSTIKADLEANKKDGLSFWDFQKKRREERPDNESSFIGTMKALWSALPESLTRPVGDVRASGPSDSLVGGSVAGAKQKVDELNAALTGATSEWPAAAQAGIRAYVDALAAGGGQAEAEADLIGGGIKDALSVTGQPQIDTSQLSRALEIARQLGAAIRSAGSTSVNLPARQIDGARAKGGPVRRGGRYLVGEEGPELLDMGVGGFIHDARSTGAMLRDMAKRAALASAIGAMPMAAAAQPPAMDPIRIAIDTSALHKLAMPAWSQSPAISMPDWPALPKLPDIDPPAATPAAQGVQAPNINVGGIKIEVHAAPGQSPQEVAEAVERVLSAKLNALSRGAFSDGA